MATKKKEKKAKKAKFIKLKNLNTLAAVLIKNYHLHVIQKNLFLN